MQGIQSKENYWRRVSQDKYLYMLLIPGLLYFFLFKYMPMGGLVIAFKDYSIFKGIWESPWVGLNNFKEIFSSIDFGNILKNTLLISIYKIIFGFPIPIIIALLLNEIRNFIFKRVIQTVLYIPHFISWVVMGGIMLAILSPNYGFIGQVFKSLSSQPLSILTSEKYFRAILVLSDIWKETGWNTIVYLAALTQINPSLYEAGIIDGANKLKLVRYITIPSISGIIILMLILRLGHLMDAGFEQIMVLQNPMVYGISDIFDTYVFRMGISRGEYSISSAIGFFKSVVALILIVSADKFSKIIGEEGIL